MYQRTRVIIAGAGKGFRLTLKEVLRHAGYAVAGEAGEGRGLLQLVFQHEPDLVLMEDRLPGCEGMDVAGIIEEHRVAPVVLVVDAGRCSIPELMRSPGIYGVLVRPLQEEMLTPVLEAALVSFNRIMELEKRLAELRKTLENRKLIARAKGLLMERHGLSEKEAYRYLQKISMDRCQSLARVAYELLNSPGHN
ncbi:ANTAR domain-containing response regulator [Desulfotomaculum copahuensis]|uniref:Stage 0 sporulation protein A homolog n=1 Tax=Desulfotomaculum copahuensis TaxID=1838280 RepID=A0A1B7LBR6_9FIRM|nr:ANTAR domain-containing protein [Desulfotomaculum copahuensis]OAT79975.1 response regulator receiver protein [Desulfotomaculum copahuensis]